jgi:hypothetical protein
VFQSSALNAFCKMAADQLTFAPVFLYIFFWLNGGLQGLSSTQIKNNISTTYPDVLIANYKVEHRQQRVLHF